MKAEENTFVRDQNARVDPLFTIGALTVAAVRRRVAAGRVTDVAAQSTSACSLDAFRELVGELQ